MRCCAALFAMLVATRAAAGSLTWQPGIEIASGPGVRGPWQQNESRYDYVDDAAVAIDASGALAVAWVDQRKKDVFLRRFGADGASRAPPLNVSRSPDTFSWLPRLAFAPDAPGRIFVLWQEIIFSGGTHGGDMLFARLAEDGAVLSAALNLSDSIAGDGKGRINPEQWHNGSFDLVAGAGGAVYAAWTEYEGALWLRVSRDGGASFAPALRIEETKPARAPSLALGPDNTLYLAWTVGDDDGADIRVARSTDGGASFGAALLIEPGPAHSDAPKIAVDRAGTVHLAWAESARGPHDRYRVRYARSSDGGASFAPSREISNANAAFPGLALDASGGVYITWELFHTNRHRPRGLGYAISRDGGASFTPPALVPGSADRPGRWNGSHQGLLTQKLAVNAKGAVALVNSSLKDGEGSRVWLIRGR